MRYRRNRPGGGGSLRLFVRVRGRVQGVGFRQATATEARRLGLTGYVRNALQRDIVECEIQGPPEAIERFLAWIRVGPPLARVDAVETEPRPDGPDQDFVIRA
jgi:acylphosphatase